MAPFLVSRSVTRFSACSGSLRISKGLALSLCALIAIPVVIATASGQARELGIPTPLVKQHATQQRSVHYTIVDRGPTLVRTLINTPGLNDHGDLAIWQTVKPSSLQGEVFHDDQSLTIVGEKDYSMVYPSDLNDELTVVGTLQIPQDLRFTHAFKWSNQQLEVLTSIGGAYSDATAINKNGEIVGSAETAQGARHAVIWSAEKAKSSTPRDLGLILQGDYSTARDINSQADIVGEANLAPAGKPRAFLWHQGKMKTLPILPGGSFCSAQALNDTDEIVGSCDLPNGTAHGVLWKAGRMKDLGTLGDDDSPSTALDINARGQIVGTSEISDSKLRAFLWQNGIMLNLNQAIAHDSGWLLLVASRINDNGEIAGRGYFHGAIHTFLLQPVSTAAPQAK